RPREIQTARMSLDELAARVVELLEPEAERSQVALKWQPGGLSPIVGDVDRLQQAVLNLMLNAVQATPKGGWVKVTTRSDGQEVELSIEDTGPGIPPELREKVFEPFFTTKESGSGLGLPLVHSIVQQHAGSLSIESGSDGGTRMVVRLPR